MVTDLRLRRFGRMQSRRAYPSDVSDEEWALVAPYLTLLPENGRSARAQSAEVFNGLRYVVRYGVGWRAMPTICRPGTPCTIKPNAG